MHCSRLMSYNKDLLTYLFSVWQQNVFFQVETGAWACTMNKGVKSQAVSDK